MALARQVIPMANYPHELREWWSDEARHRAEYDLSADQWDELVDLCKRRVADIRRDAEPYEVI